MRNSVIPTGNTGATTNPNAMTYRVYVPVDLEVASGSNAYSPETADLRIPSLGKMSASVDLSCSAPANTTATSVRFRTDDTAPNSFVQISIEDRYE